MQKRYLAVDPGEKRIGLAISDASGTIANPLRIIEHHSRAENALRIIDIAQEHDVQEIIIGQSIDDEGEPSLQGRRAARLAVVIRSLSDIPVILWDEGFSTQEALQARIAMQIKKSKRRDHVDDVAATVILQAYLESKRDKQTGSKK